VEVAQLQRKSENLKDILQETGKRKLRRYWVGYRVGMDTAARDAAGNQPQMSSPWLRRY
jgi:hypothetical protein